ncbi:MAG: PSD1 and planctomycete cytochrome C domain-containing protein [Planctomycetota bacterium]
MARHRPGLLGPFLLLHATALAAGPRKLEFNRDVRPILSDNCFPCHGPDRNARKAKLRLDVREEALKKEAFVPGNADASELVRRIFTDDDHDHMPPARSLRKLTAAQKDMLREWVAQGAEYQPHWAYIAPTRPPVPAVEHARWLQNPIDAFIIGKLEEQGIEPSPAADRATLARRVSLDLVGLPPSIAEVDQLASAASDRAYEELVDRLLASPHYGERMAVPWLDVVRFADTVGYHGDQGQNIFPYRDYVIDSFNQNKPFDQFTIEQLAGDLLQDATVEQRIATGFNRLNMMTREGGAQPNEYLAKYTADRVRTVAGTWLGSTMGCCECHDHKFDPFTTKDFYQLGAFFADLKQWGVYQSYDYTPNPDLAGFTNDHPFPPEIDVPSRYLAQRIAAKRAMLTALAQSTAVSIDRARFDAWREQCRTFLAAHASGWESPVTAASVTAPVEKDGRVLLPPGRSVLRCVLAPTSQWVAAIKVELLADARHQDSILREGAGDTTIGVSATVLTRSDAVEHALAWRHADANHKAPRYFNGHEIIGTKDAWAVAARDPRAPPGGGYMLGAPRALAPGDTLSVEVSGEGLGCVRVSSSPIAPADVLLPDVGAELTRALQSDAPAALALETYLRSTAWHATAFAQLVRLDAQIAECRGGRAMTMVSEAITPPRTWRVLPRGNWQDESGEVVEPAVPHFLPQQEAAGRRLTRLDLARWLVAPENPLTARVIANRLWKQFFGTGLSAIVDDVGAQGEWPTHPELLDWLAVELRESGWDVKHLVRLMVTSATYRQSSLPRAELRERDPLNRWLGRQNARPLEAEFVRDNALSIGGLLALDVGGPSANPYQPPGYYANLQFPDRDYVADGDDRQYRRGVYVHWQRTFLHPMLAAFDAPSREECTASRVVANTPQQALTLLNDPTFVEAARAFAARLLEQSAAGDQARIELAFRTALARRAQQREQDAMLRFLVARRLEFAQHAEAAQQLLGIGLCPIAAGANQPELAAWTATCRVILNLHETNVRY